MSLESRFTRWAGIPTLPFGAGGSATGLSATDAYGQSLGPVMDVSVPEGGIWAYKSVGHHGNVLTAEPPLARGAEATPCWSKVQAVPSTDVDFWKSPKAEPGNAFARPIVILAIR